MASKKEWQLVVDAGTDVSFVIPKRLNKKELRLLEKKMQEALEGIIKETFPGSEERPVGTNSVWCDLMQYEYGEEEEY